MTEVKTILVVAGNLDEFRDFAREKKSKCKSFEATKGFPQFTIDGKTRYIYVPSPHSMHGFNRAEVMYLGSWQDRRDIEEIKRIAQFMVP